MQAKASEEISIRVGKLEVELVNCWRLSVNKSESKSPEEPGAVAQACNPSTLGGRGRRIA